MIKFEIDGRTIDPNNIADALLSAAIESWKEQLAEKIGSIRDPETGEFPTVIIRGDSLDNLTLKIEGSDRVIALVKERLDIRDDDEPGDTSKPIDEPRVFLSYTSDDVELAKKVAETLQSNGIDVWWDKWCITAGDSLRQKIDEGISGCTHFLVLLTSRSIKKPWVNQEMDAGLVRKLNDQCRFLPVRYQLDAKDLPPLLSGMYAPEIGSDDALGQLVSDIHGISRKPPAGSPPQALAEYKTTATGYSVAASAIARLIVERSQNGVSFDPQLTVEEISSVLCLTDEDTTDALHELSGFLDADAWGRVRPHDALFPEFDRHWKPWDPAVDALRLAADVVNVGGFPSLASEIAKQYGWEPRRLNPAINYLLERRLIEDEKYIGTGPFTMMRVTRTDALRRFVKSRV